MAEKSRKKRLILINPANPMMKGIFRRPALQPPLALAIIASLTPPDWEVRIIDENFRHFHYKEADLVGITALSSTSPRAYEIAAEFREKGIPVILGGVHATLMPDEALNYVDSVVMGYVEEVWQEIIKDFENGELKKKYKKPIDITKKIPIPRYDLLHPAYMFGSLQTSRGCQMHCDFCTIPVMNDHKYQLRNVDDVLDELQAIPQKLIYIVDDNLVGLGTGPREHARRLFQGMIDRNLNKEWFAYVSLGFGDDEELVKLAVKSGCKMVLIGMESEKPDQLKKINKRVNSALGPESYRKVVRILHRHGICVVGSFIFGLDTDTKEDLRARLKFMLRSSFDNPLPNVMTPFPGTRIFDRILAEDRLLYQDFPKDWKKFHGAHVVYKPTYLDPGFLSKEMEYITKSLYRRDRVLIRLIRTLWNTRRLRTAVWAYSHNVNLRELTKHPDALFYDQEV